jgi:hypothetical protein
MSDHPNQVAAVGVGALVGIGHFAHMIEPILADLSYLAAIVVAGLAVYQKIRKKCWSSAIRVLS